MADEKIPEEYLKRYNQGYTLAQRVPSFNSNLGKGSSSLEMQGFKAGIEQARIDKFKARSQQRIPDTTKGTQPPKSGPDVSR